MPQSTRDPNPKSQISSDWGWGCRYLIQCRVVYYRAIWEHLWKSVMLKIPYNLGIHIHLSSVLFIVGRYTYLTLMMNHCRNLIKSKYIPTYLKKIITIEKCHKKWSSTLEVEDSISVKTNRNWKKKKNRVGCLLHWAELSVICISIISLSLPPLFISLFVFIFVNTSFTYRFIYLRLMESICFPFHHVWGMRIFIPTIHDYIGT